MLNNATLVGNETAIKSQETIIVADRSLEGNPASKVQNNVKRIVLTKLHIIIDEENDLPKLIM